MSDIARQLVLASASPRRKSLLAEAGYDFIVIPSTIQEPDEVADQAGPAALAESLSFFKASFVAGSLRNATVIGADTVVELNGRIYGKAADAQDARRILTALLREPHRVITGLTVIDSDSDQREITHAVTRVTMSPMPPAELDDYIASGIWKGKAGAYGIQDHNGRYVERTEGSFTNVMGLPMDLLEPILARWGHHPARPGAPA